MKEYEISDFSNTDGNITLKSINKIVKDKNSGTGKRK